MRIHISAPHLDITINDSNGNGVFQYHAKDYVLSFDIARAIQEAGKLVQMIDSLDSPARPGANVSDILMEAAREAEARRAEQAAEPDPTAPDADGWRAHKRLWLPKSAPVTAGLHEKVDVKLRSGEVREGAGPGSLNWSMDPDDPSPGDIIAWRPAQ